MTTLRSTLILLVLFPGFGTAGQLQIIGHGVAINSCDGTITATSSCGTCKARTVSVPLATLSSAESTVSIPDGEWEIAIHSTRCWAPAILFQASAQADHPQLPLWLASELTGTIGNTGEGAKNLQAEIRVPGETEKLPGSLLPQTCAVSGSQWRCSAPATTFQLRLAIGEHHAPRYVPQLTLTSGERKDLGVMTFVPGASVAGLVTIPHERHVNATVAVIPSSKKPTDQVGARAIVNDASGGLFQFTGVTPGIYHVVVTRPGWLRAEVQGVRVTANHESFLPQPISMKRAAAVDVFISPPLAIAGQPWRVQLDRAGPSGSNVKILESPGTFAGEWRNDQLQPGTYNLVIMDPRGSVFLRQTIEATPDAAPMFLNVTRIHVRGIVRVGEAPFEAHLIFTGGAGARVTMAADSSGRFEGVLPQDGPWDVEVRSAAETFYVNSVVNIKPNSQEAVADVTVTLPGGKVKGRVVNDAGEPVTADVLVFRNGRQIADAAAELPDGTFELSGLRPGPVELQAKAHPGEGDLTPYLVSEDDPPSIELVAHTLNDVKCEVLAQDGTPISGAMIRYNDGMSARPGRTVSGPNGEFSLRVRSGAGPVLIAIAAPGFPSTLATVNAQEKVKQLLVVGTASALLHIVHRPEMRWPYITLDGHLYLAVPALLPIGPAGIVGMVVDGLEIRIAPGVYSICDSVGGPCQSARLAAGQQFNFLPAGGASN